MQTRAMEAQAPPIYIVIPGRVYRPDTPDATHVPMFHQLEGLAIDEDITLADLQGVLLAFARQMFGEHTEVRLRPGYFPFTEPSVEVDVSCFRCGGTGYEGASRCCTCKGEGWIEILGSGMVDPNVLDYVKRQRLRPRARAGLRVRHGDRADRERGPRGARPAHALRERRSPAGAVRRMRVPVAWLKEYCDPGSSAEEIADTLTMSGLKLERLHRVGWATRSSSWSARSSRPSRTRTPTGSRSARSTSGRHADDRLRRARTWPPGRRWRWRSRARSCRTAPRSARRSCAGWSRTG